jgi:PAS domain S-box-containing protein
MDTKPSYEELIQRVDALEQGELERKAAEQELHENRKLLSLILDSTKDGILVGHIDGHFPYANKRFAEMWNIPQKLIEEKNREELHKIVLKQLKNPEDFQTKLGLLYQSSQKADDIIEFKDGRVFERHSEPLFKEGKTYGRVWSFHDITEQMRTGEKIQKQYRFLETFFDAIPFPFFLKDIDTKYLGCSPSYAEIFGLDTEEIVGKRSEDIFSKDIASVHNQADRELFKNPGTQIYEYQFKHADGSLHDKIVSKATYNDDDGNLAGMVGFYTDITDRKQTEKALRESEERYRNLFELSPDGIVIWQDEKAALTNPAAIRMFGATSDEEIIGKSIYEIHPIESHDKLKARLKYTFETGLPAAPTEYKFIRLDNQMLDVEATGITINYRNRPALLSLYRDILERKQAEKALKKYERIVASSSDHMALLDRNYVYQTVNEAYLQSLGKKREDIIGYSVPELFGQEFFEKNQKSNIDRCLAGEIVRYQKLIDFSDTGQRYMEIVHYPYYEDGDTVSGYVVNARDITEQKELENRLQQSQKMESIGTLAGGIAHDFNNILSPIMILSEMVMLDLPSGSPLQQNIKQIYKAGERARDLVKQILTFARKQKKELIPIRVSQVLKEAIKLLRSSIPTTIDIQYDINPELDIVLSDPTQLNLIIMNLCTNAAHAMEENGGTLKINLKNENLDSESANAFHGLESGRYIKLSVRDNGHGIKPQLTDKIFDPYFTTKEVGKGTGMGLALVHGIVKSYGGAVTVESKVGKETCFHVYLPTVEGDVDAVEAAQDPVPLPTGTEKILFVDDEKAAVDLMQSMLEKFGYKVTARTSSIEALEAFHNNPKGFDLVITDMTMPNMTGKALAKEMMSIRPDIPIIICTGFSEQIDEKGAKEMGIRAFLMKPIIMQKITNTIRQVLDDG